MIGRISVAAISICIAACATSGPEAPAPTVTASPASVGAAASGSPPIPAEADLQNLDAAENPQTASASPEKGDPDELICRREMETGSKFYTKICRTRAEIEARAAADQAIMETGRRINTGSECALTGDC